MREFDFDSVKRQYSKYIRDKQVSDTSYRLRAGRPIVTDEILGIPINISDAQKTITGGYVRRGSKGYFGSDDEDRRA